MPIFSSYKAPITNTKPYRNTTLVKVHKIITGKYLDKITAQLRSISNKEENRKFKSQNFPYVTFSGTFSKRSNEELVHHSGYLVLDFDYLSNVEQLKQELIQDPWFETQLLFVSPNGYGLKWIIEIDIPENLTHEKMFDAVSNYIESTYSIKVDKGCDVSRACFLCHDPQAYIHKKYSEK